MTARKLTPLEVWHYANCRLNYLKGEVGLSEEMALVQMAAEDGLDLDWLRHLVGGSLPLYHA